VIRQEAEVPIAPIETLESPKTGQQPLGWGALMLLCVLSLCLAMAISEFVEHRVVMPACKAYAAERGLVFKAVDVYSLRQDEPGAHCLFTQTDGGESAMWLQRVAPLHTDFWVSLVIDIELSTPVLWVLTSLLWIGVRRLWSSPRREPMRQPTD
jgi:hypothetical protein